MHWISAKGAEEFAKLLGCRLPTGGEWKAAYEYEKEESLKENGETARWNLRDPSVDKERSFLKEKSSLNFQLPEVDGDNFVPPVIQDDKEPQCWDQHDGALWFESVRNPNRGHTFLHIVGNVAEFVQEGNDFYVIGGSALSPRALAYDKECRVDDPSHTRYYSDVGFRLALPATGQSLCSRAKKAFDDAKFLLSPKVEMANNPTRRIDGPGM